MNVDATAGVIARPPLLFLAALLLGFAADHLLAPGIQAASGLHLPFPVPDTDRVHWILGGFLTITGFALAAGGIRDFIRAATPVPTNQPTCALVTTGFHGFCRNPIYLGLFLV